jgi:DNA polymerase-3 subunit epsilon
MRQVVLDTETTGIGHENGHRIIEIGCVEMVDRRLSNRHFHAYLNPEREVDAGAFKVHGISDTFLSDKPLFKEILPEFLAFISGAELIIHNAPFDLGFLNAELRRANYAHSIEHHCGFFDTLVYAREKHPGLRNNLDALCKRYNIDNSNRNLHGALLDAEILAWVYLAMTGGQTEMFAEDLLPNSQENQIRHASILQSLSPIITATEQELSSHDDFIQFLIKKSGVDLFTTHLTD